MPTTTNFGWTTPADTDLVKDGAAAIRTLAGNIDTSLVDLKGGTTGQFLSKNSNTDLDFVFATPASGGMTLLSTTTLSGASTTISGISGSYNDLAIVIFGVTNATDTGAFRCAPNGSTNITDFINVRTSVLNLSNGGYLEVSGTSTNGPLYTDATNSWTINIKNYASTTSRKPLEVYGTYINGSSVRRGYFLFGGINTTSAITSLVFDNSGGNLSTGTVLLYGVK